MKNTQRNGGDGFTYKTQKDIVVNQQPVAYTGKWVDFLVHKIYCTSQMTQQNTKVHIGQLHNLSSVSANETHQRRKNFYISRWHVVKDTSLNEYDIDTWPSDAENQPGLLDVKLVVIGCMCKQLL